MKATKRVSTQKSNGRRAFLKGAVATGVAGAAGVAAASALPEAAEATVEPGDSRNYRETAHIRAYYRAARF